MPIKLMSVYTVVIDYGGRYVYINHIDEASANDRAQAINDKGEFALSARVVPSIVDTVFCNKNIRDEYQRRVGAGEPLIWEE